MTTYQNGAAVTVRHDMGTEQAVVISHTSGSDNLRYTVRFADGTISSWAAFQVSPA